VTNGGTPPFGSDSEQQQTGPVVRDNRKIDPETGEVRQRARETTPSPGPAADAGAPSEPLVEEAASNVGQAEIDDLKQQVADRTLDLQRLQAEYINYKRRVERDRQAVRELAVASVLTDLLPVIDDIGRAREHGELEGGFKAVAESLEASVNPHVHEALMHAYSDEVTVASVSHLLQPGYRLGERVLRPARVAVAEPTEGLPAQPAAESAQGDQQDDNSEPQAQPSESDAQPDQGEQG
jgi:molecular chaperone GrpE